MAMPAPPIPPAMPPPPHPSSLPSTVRSQPQLRSATGPALPRGDPRPRSRVLRPVAPATWGGRGLAGAAPPGMAGGCHRGSRLRLRRPRLPVTAEQPGYVPLCCGLNVPCSRWKAQPHCRSARRRPWRAEHTLRGDSAGVGSLPLCDGVRGAAPQRRVRTRGGAGVSDTHPPVPGPWTPGLQPEERPQHPAVSGPRHERCAPRDLPSAPGGRDQVRVPQNRHSAPVWSSEGQRLSRPAAYTAGPDSVLRRLSACRAPPMARDPPAASQACPEP